MVIKVGEPALGRLKMSTATSNKEPKVNTFISSAAVIKFSGGSVGTEQMDGLRGRGGHAPFQDVRLPETPLTQQGR